MISTEQISNVIGTTVVDRDGSKIGKAGQVYLDDATGEPAWVTVNTGLFGNNESFVPLEAASLEGDTLRVAHTKDAVKDAPNVAADGHLEPSEEEQLYRHYDMGMTSGTGDAGMAADTGNRTDTTRTDTTRTEGHDTSGPTTDQAMTRSEERLKVGTQTQETGRARLRKHVVTEQETVTVPVSREEVRIEREPIDASNADAAHDGPAISEEEHEVVLREERPVVTTEAVPVERVKLGTETVTEQEQVTGEVRKEQIETDDVDVRGGTKDRTDRR